MNIVILCDSKFGNTRSLADAMEAALKADHRVEVRSPSAGLPEPGSVDLLLVGGPTHAHGASAPLKTTLGQVHKGALLGVRSAAFDTRFGMARILTGSAAGVATKWLKRAGAMIVAPPESFIVTRTDPPALIDGELTRAATWAREVAAA